MGWHINKRSSCLGCPWLPALLRNTWMRLSFCRSSFLCGLRPICAHWRRRMCRARWTKERTCSQGTTSPQGNRRSRFRKFVRARVDLFASKDNSHCPIFFTKSTECSGPRVAQSSALCFPCNRSATTGTQANQGATAQAYFNSLPLEEPAEGVGVIPAARSSPVADPLETGPSLSSERYAMASTAQFMGPACVAAQWEAFMPTRECPKHDGRS